MAGAVLSWPVMGPRLALALLLGIVSCTERAPGDSTDATSTSTTTTASTASTTGTAATTTTTTATTTTDAPTTGIGSTGDTGDFCLDAHYHAPEAPAWKLTCELPELCRGDGPLVFQLGAAELLMPETVEVDDLERARCMVTALRERTVGQISWLVVADSWVIFDPLSLEILGDAALARSARFPVELIAPNNTYEGLYALRSPDFFAACEGGDALQVWLCLVDPAVPTCLPGPLPCPD